MLGLTDAARVVLDACEVTFAGERVILRCRRCGEQLPHGAADHARVLAFYVRAHQLRCVARHPESAYPSRPRKTPSTDAS